MDTASGDILSHLVEVERKASELEASAQREAEARVAKARLEADSRMRERLDAERRALDAEFSAKIEELKLTHERELERVRREARRVLPQEEAEAFMRSFLGVVG